MKKFVHVLLTIVLLLQFVIPQIAIAETLISGEEGVSLKSVSLDPTSKKERAIISLTLDAKTAEEQKAVIQSSSGLTLMPSSSNELKDASGRVKGTYQIVDNAVQLSVAGEVDEELSLTIEGQVAEASSEKQVQFTLGNSSKVLNLPEGWFLTESTTTDSTINNSSASTETVSSTTTETSSSSETGGIKESKAAQEKNSTLRRDPVNIQNIYDDLGIADDFLTNMDLSYTDKDGNPVENPTIDDTIHFNFNFTLDETVRENMQAGDYYEFNLPDSVKVTQNQTYPLNDADGNHYADVTIGTDGKITIVFTDEIEHASDIEGDFHFTGEFDKDNIDGPGEIVIVPPGHEDIGETVTIKPNYSGDNIDKKGHFDKEQNPDKIIWNVDINKALDTLENAVVTENFPAGTVYESVVVYQVDVDFDGNVIEGSEKVADPSTYTVDADGTVHFTNKIDGAYRLEYTTRIDEDAKPDEGGLTSFQNQAVLSSKGIEDATAEATVSTSYGKKIDKARGDYDSDNQTINWKIHYNYGEKDINNGSIIDTFQDEHMFLVDGTIKLYEVSFDQNGRPVRGRQLVEGQDYTLDTSSGHGFEIHFIGTVDTAVDVLYQTGYDGIVDENTTITNAVKTETGEDDTSSGILNPQNVIKKLGQVDYTNHTVGWNLDVNLNHYSMNNWKMTDTLSKGLTLLEDTLVIYDKDAKKDLILGTDYTLDYDQTTNQFEIVFIGNYVKTDHAFKISYTTAYDPEAVPENDPDKKFTNTAKVTWTTDDGETITNEDVATFKPNEPTKYNGAKSGSYNAQEKAITWTVTVNYGDKDLVNAQLTDPIPANQKYILNSLTIYHYTVTSDGNVIKGNELTQEEYRELGIEQPSAANNQTLIVEFPDNEAGQYLIEFKTDVTNEQIHAEYTNDAVFSNDKYEDHTLHGKVTVNHGDEFGSKSGKQDEDGFVNWSVTLNGSQSKLYDVTVEDMPSDNQSIDLDSLHIFGTTVAVDGTITIDRTKELVKDQDYTVGLTTDNQTGQQKMTIHFVNNYQEFDTPLIMEYKSMVFLEGNKGTVSNQVHITSEGKTEVDDTSDGKTDVTVSEGGGSSSGIRGQLILKKEDNNGNVLPEGATFELWDKNQTQILRSGTVGSNGLITFGNLPFGTYILKETGTLTEQGYTIDQSLVDGKKVTINQQTTDGVPVVIKNQLGTVQLVKKDEQGELLSGAEFRLEVYDEVTGTWLPKSVNQALTTDKKGVLTIHGLTPGKYRLIETKAPAGYILNTNPVPFEVAENSDHQLIQIGMKEAFINYKATIQFMKQDEAGNPLAGAVFGLYKKGSTTPVATTASKPDGRVVFANVGPGTYEIKEISNPNDYVLNTQVLDNIVVPESSNKPLDPIILADDFINYKGSAEITKYGETSTETKALAGVEFVLEDGNGKTVAQGTTDQNGRYFVDGLAPGTYYFRETSTGPNHEFLVNTEKVKVVVEPNTLGKPETVEATLTDYQGSFKIKKVDSKGNPLEGAEFSLFSINRELIASGLTSAENGIVSYEGLAPGRYYLSETKAPLDENGQEYVKDEYPIWLNVVGEAQGKPETINLGEFQNFKGKIGLTKTGAGHLSIAGAKFALYKASGQNNSEEKLVKIDGKDFIEVGADGHINIDSLGPGYYKLIEIEAPAGYVINTQPIYFTVREGEETDPPVEEVSIVNYEASITARKVSDDESLETPPLLRNGLSGAEFQILDDKGNVVKVFDTKGDETTTLIANQDGVISASGLHAGKYTLVETKSPDGYILEKEGIPFTVTDQSGETTPINLGTIENHRGSIEVEKKNEHGELLNGGSFEIRDAKGQVVTVTNALGFETKTLTALDGKIEATGLVPGKYSVVETKAPDGYILETNQKVMPFEIAASENEHHEITFQDTFTNYQGSVELNKVDTDSKKALTGAEFNLYTSEGTLVKKQLITDQNGRLIVNDLVPGDYYFVEQKAPTGYQLTNDKQPFTIVENANGKPKQINLTVTNSKQPEKEPSKKTPTPPVQKHLGGNLANLGEQSGTSLIVLGTLVIIGLGGYVVYRRKKNK